MRLISWFHQKDTFKLIRGRRYAPTLLKLFQRSCFSGSFSSVPARFVWSLRAIALIAVAIMLFASDEDRFYGTSAFPGSGGMGGLAAVRRKNWTDTELLMPVKKHSINLRIDKD